MINRFFTTLTSTIEETEIIKEPTLFEELYDYFTQKYLTPNYGSYENITIQNDPVVSTALAIIAGFIAVMVGASVMIFTKRTLGRLVRRLVKNEALSPESAKTIDEIGLGKSRAIRWFINKMTLSKAVRCREEDEYYGIGTDESKKDAYKVSLVTPRKLKYKRNPKTDHFYIPEEQKHRALIRFDQKGTNPMMLLVLAVVYIVMALIIVKLLPSLVGFADGAMGAFKGA